MDKARRAFLAKLRKGELPEKEERELRERRRIEEESRREGESRWEAILANFDRELRICDMDFTDLQVGEDYGCCCCKNCHIECLPTVES